MKYYEMKSYINILPYIYYCLIETLWNLKLPQALKVLKVNNHSTAIYFSPLNSLYHYNNFIKTNLPRIDWMFHTGYP